MKVTAKECIKSQSFTIRPLGFTDTLTVHVESNCNCNCKEQPDPAACSGQGSIVCGICRYVPSTQNTVPNAAGAGELLEGAVRSSPGLGSAALHQFSLSEVDYIHGHGRHNVSPVGEASAAFLRAPNHYPPIHPPIYQSIQHSTHPSNHPSSYPFIHPPNHPLNRNRSLFHSKSHSWVQFLQVLRALPGPLVTGREKD